MFSEENIEGFFSEVFVQENQKETVVNEFTAYAKFQASTFSSKKVTLHLHKVERSFSQRKSQSEFFSFEDYLVSYMEHLSNSNLHFKLKKVFLDENTERAISKLGNWKLEVIRLLLSSDSQLMKDFTYSTHSPSRKTV